MSDSLAIAQSFAAMQAASTQQALQTEMLRQQTQSDQAIVALLQQSADQMQATLPAGQGQAVDITA
ncbi:MAG: hypothetical protein Q8S58_11820 [Bosea sp. (in: a-proteobacteria)]|uniref:hypothetical protein n=1 Tax=Bosea sp. (in: a-proteobacteria) TaxID=1871050 RepID=UPI0027353E13|nr:hypothetical protein [Bosea sp. (in: a-proteobacteria)]MDP3255103.1 hypothetical protein [Bosea sp. (in: a-proteobacteria)]MDP3319807.1 hypothetical protein [Bosea sp. (in: a-proteobacteria)]